MNSSAPPGSSSKEIALVLSQQPHYTTHIREFFSRFSYAVNDSLTENSTATYCVIAGSAKYVKEIFSTLPQGLRRVVCIVWEGSVEELETQKNTFPYKTVLVAPQLIAPREVQQIFAFLFDERSKLLILGSPHIPSVKKHDTPPPTPHHRPATSLSASTDTDRIAKLMEDIYHPPSAKKVATKRVSKSKVSGYVFFLLLSPIVLFCCSLLIEILSLVGGGVSLKNNWQAVTPAFIQTATGSRHARKLAFSVSTFPFQLPPLLPISHTLESPLFLLDNLHVILKNSQIIVKEADVLKTSLLLSSEHSESNNEAQTKLTLAVEDVYQHILLFTAQADKLPAIRFLLSPVRNKLQMLLPLLSTLRTVLTLYGANASAEGDQVFLALLQNNMELRPTGGFIGSLSEVKVRDGKILDMIIRDVYDVDGQMRGHVDPPAPIRSLLRQEHWYLRDSNWDPDFEHSATRAAWFYEKETGVKARGVVGITASLVVDLLQLTGPIFLPDYNDTITAENFFGKSLFYTQANFFPGSTQKKDFLATLLRGIGESLQSERRLSPLAFLRFLHDSFLKKTVMFYHTDPYIQEYLRFVNWAGTVPGQPLCAGGRPSCIPFFLYIADANVSINKVNYYIQTERVHDIHVDEAGAIQETVRVSYKNTSTTDIQGGGNYRSYAQIYLPSDSSLTKLTLNGVSVPTKPTTATDTAPPYTEALGITPLFFHFGVALDVPANQTVTLEFTYDRREKRVLPTSPNTFDIVYQRQPGSDVSQITTRIIYPLSLHADVTDLYTLSGVKANTPTLLAKDGGVEYNTTLGQDKHVQLHLAPQ